MLLPFQYIISVDRRKLNEKLLSAAEAQDGVQIHFDHALHSMDLDAKKATFKLPDNSSTTVTSDLFIGADGAFSATRKEIMKKTRCVFSLLSLSSGKENKKKQLIISISMNFNQQYIDHAYKELTIPAKGGRHVLDANSLHVWPRGGFMLIALPNTDGSFTATLFLARMGANSFATLSSATAINDFFRWEFPDAVPLMPNLAQEFAANPQGQLGTVHVTPWHVGGSVLLLGDAAHAIVPFHGQGMNAAFEDCAILDALLDQHNVSTHDANDIRAWSTLFSDVSRSRRPNADAIAEMALENYTEMRDNVLDAGFARRKSIAMELERRFPDRFIPRYSMVMFHPEIPYTDALRRGTIQADILAQLDAKRDASGNTDAKLAEKLIKDRLSPVS